MRAAPNPSGASLRALAHRPEASDDLRLQLANGLYNAHTVAAQVDHAVLAGSLLEEIRELARYADAAHPLRLFLNSGMLDSRVSHMADGPVIVR